MKLVVQRVTKAKVSVRGETISDINKGYMVLVGIGENDTEEEAKYLAKKLINLRVFEDEAGKMNKSIKDIEGELLLVSQFTLYANTKSGNRPSFIEAAKPDKAKALYEYFAKECEKEASVVKRGIFQEYMQVELVNDGPCTIILEK